MSSDSEIEFGELDVAKPQLERTPHENRHFAVVPLGAPAEGELPVYVDLDAMMDMEAHALSDTSVELGGVMLGGQFEDAQGRPFVVVSDCLRASHYESTKGSFKFTHDTWSEITRQRDEFPPELQMVGWYHTHPDWGVFLSGMDTFICDNFFNRPLDVALVIDPCRGDRGFFQWTTGRRKNLARTGGFYIMASRHRREALEHFVECLEGGYAMPAASHLMSGQGAAPVVHLHDRRSNWIGPAVVTLLVVQACLTLLLAARLFVPGFGLAAPTAGNEEVAASQQPSGPTEAEITAADLAAQRELLDRIIAQLGTDQPGGPQEGFATLREEQRQENAHLRAAQRGYVALEAENLRLASELAKTQQERDNRIDEVAELRQDFSDVKAAHKAQVDALEEEISTLKKELGGDEEQADAASSYRRWLTWVGIGGVCLALVVGGVIFALRGAETLEAKEDRDDARED